MKEKGFPNSSWRIGQNVWVHCGVVNTLLPTRVGEWVPGRLLRTGDDLHVEVLTDKAPLLFSVGVKDLLPRASDLFFIKDGYLCALSSLNEADLLMALLERHRSGFRFTSAGQILIVLTDPVIEQKDSHSFSPSIVSFANVEYRRIFIQYVPRVVVFSGVSNSGKSTSFRCFLSQICQLPKDPVSLSFGRRISCAVSALYDLCSLSNGRIGTGLLTGLKFDPLNEQVVGARLWIAPFNLCSFDSHSSSYQPLLFMDTLLSAPESMLRTLKLSELVEDGRHSAVVGLMRRQLDESRVGTGRDRYNRLKTGLESLGMSENEIVRLFKTLAACILFTQMMACVDPSNVKLMGAIAELLGMTSFNFLRVIFTESDSGSGKYLFNRIGSNWLQTVSYVANYVYLCCVFYLQSRVNLALGKLSEADLQTTSLFMLDAPGVVNSDSDVSISELISNVNSDLVTAFLHHQMVRKGSGNAEQSVELWIGRLGIFSSLFSFDKATPVSQNSFGYNTNQLPSALVHRLRGIYQSNSCLLEVSRQRIVSRHWIGRCSYSAGEILKAQTLIIPSSVTEMSRLSKNVIFSQGESLIPGFEQSRQGGGFSLIKLMRSMMFSLIKPISGGIPTSMCHIRVDKENFDLGVLDQLRKMTPIYASLLQERKSLPVCLPVETLLDKYWELIEDFSRVGKDALEQILIHLYSHSNNHHHRVIGSRVLLSKGCLEYLDHRLADKRNAVVTLQRKWRKQSFPGRSSSRSEYRAAIRIQATWRGYRARRNLNLLLGRHAFASTAATVIQRWWRRQVAAEIVRHRADSMRKESMRADVQFKFSSAPSESGDSETEQTARPSYSRSDVLDSFEGIQSSNTLIEKFKARSVLPGPPAIAKKVTTKLKEPVTLRMYRDWKLSHLERSPDKLETYTPFSVHEPVNKPARLPDQYVESPKITTQANAMKLVPLRERQSQVIAEREKRISLLRKQLQEQQDRALLFRPQIHPMSRKIKGRGDPDSFTKWQKLNEARIEERRRQKVDEEMKEVRSTPSALNPKSRKILERKGTPSASVFERINERSKQIEKKIEEKRKRELDEQRLRSSHVLGAQHMDGLLSPVSSVLATPGTDALGRIYKYAPKSNDKIFERLLYGAGTPVSQRSKKAHSNNHSPVVQEVNNLLDLIVLQHTVMPGEPVVMDPARFQVSQKERSVGEWQRLLDESTL